MTNTYCITAAPKHGSVQTDTTLYLTADGKFSKFPWKAAKVNDSDKAEVLVEILESKFKTFSFDYCPY